MKLTPWFSGDQKPVRVGTYQRDFGPAVLWCYWDGRRWSVSSNYREKPKFYAQNKDYSAVQDLPWRGVMK